MAVINGELTHIVAAMVTAESLPRLQGAGLTFQLLLPQEGRCRLFQKTPRETVSLPIPYNQSKGRFDAFGAGYLLLPLETRPPGPRDPGKLLLTCSDHEFPCQSGDAGVGIFLE